MVLALKKRRTSAQTYLRKNYLKTGSLIANAARATVRRRPLAAAAETDCSSTV